MIACFDRDRLSVGRTHDGGSARDERLPDAV